MILMKLKITKIIIAQIRKIIILPIKKKLSLRMNILVQYQKIFLKQKRKVRQVLKVKRMIVIFQIIKILII